MSSFKYNFQKMRKLYFQVWLKNICVSTGVATNCCDRHTHRHTDTQTGIIPDVKIFSNGKTEYKNALYGSHFLYFFPIQKYVQILSDNSQSWVCHEIGARFPVMWERPPLSSVVHCCRGLPRRELPRHVCLYKIFDYGWFLPKFSTNLIYNYSSILPS